MRKQCAPASFGRRPAWSCWLTPVINCVAKVPFWRQDRWKLWHVEAWKNIVEVGLFIFENVCRFFSEGRCMWPKYKAIAPFHFLKVYQSWQSKDLIDKYKDNGPNYTLFLRPHFFQSNYLSKDAKHIHDGFKPECHTTNFCLRLGMDIMTYLRTCGPVVPKKRGDLQKGTI